MPLAEPGSVVNQDDLYVQHDEDDSRSALGESLTPEGDKGKDAPSTQARKAQNRIAQREFRLRKQQYIRDLEARVEVLSGDKEERVELMTLLIRNLLKENKELRSLCKSMASFVGEGLGSCLPRLGLSAPQLDAILNRLDTDTAYEAFAALKASREMEAANPGIQFGERRRPSSNAKRKRSNALSNSEHPTEEMMEEGSEFAGRSKRTQHDDDTLSQAVASYAYLFPDLEAFSLPGRSNDGYDPSGPLSSQQSMNPEYPYSIFASPGPSTGQHTYQASLPNNSSAHSNFSGFGLMVPPPSIPLKGFQDGPPTMPISASDARSVLDLAASSDILAKTAERQRQLRAAVAHITNSESEGKLNAVPVVPYEDGERDRDLQAALKERMEGLDSENSKTEAMQLITYHLSKFRVNHSYDLPASLKPTRVQRTVPHEHAIDGIIFPTIRDRMILLRGRYDLVDAFQGMLNEFRIHGEDPLDHHNWEVSEKWIADFKLLVDDEVYSISNHWRAQRDDAPLVRLEMPNHAVGAPIAPPQPMLQSEM